MRIDLPGKYLARDDRIVDIFRVDRTTAVGRHPDDTQAMVWDVYTGEAIGHDLQHSLVKLLPPQPPEVTKSGRKPRQKAVQ
jgi:hypothetical protein